MSGLQLALASGTLIGLGFALLVWRLTPSDPDLVDALDRLSPDRVVPRRGADALDAEDDDAAAEAPSPVDRIGVWSLKNLPGGAWAHTPRKDLAILQISETRFYGEKVVWALLGLVMPPLLATFFTLIGLPLPFVIPTIGSLALAALFWFMPNYNAADDAKKARIAFNRALGAYIDMVATGVRDGASGQQALRAAAEVGDKWVFKRIERELRRARYMTRAPWDSLHALADELGVPELDDLADIMAQSGQDGSQIYTSLRARAAALRSAMLSAEVGKANAASERMYIPASLLGVVFMAILIAPSMLRFTT
jgi:Flp pilus assembly protein TadB